MPKTTNTPSRVKREKYSFKPLKKLSGFMGWLHHTAAFEAYTREPETEARETLCVAEWNTPSSTPDQDDSLIRRLYVLDPEDLCEFSLEEVVLAWQYRRESCGSLAAAAELMALYRLAIGEDESYIGASSYLAHPEVLAIFEQVAESCPPSLSSTDAAATVETASVPATLLSLADVRTLSAAQLMQAWEGRPDTFASLEAAAETLATLRWLSSGSAEKTSFQHFLNHALIQDLEVNRPSFPRHSPSSGNSAFQTPLAIAA